MPFQFQINTPNTALQTMQVIDSMEARREARDLQKQSLQLRMQEAASKLDERQKARAKEGLEGMARVAGAARNGQEWDEGMRGLVAQGYKEFESEVGKWSPERAAFNLRKAQDAKTLFENSPEQRAANVQQKADEYRATVPDRMRVQAAGRTTVNVAAPVIPQQPVPKFNDKGQVIGYEYPPEPQQPGARGAAGAKAPPGALSQPTVNKLEETAVDNATQLSRIDQIDREFDPRWLDVRTRVGQSATATKEKFGLNVTPEDQADLRRYTQFRRSTTDNLNRTIKELTGSAMGVEEAQRIISTMPNAGTGWLDGDSPTEFKAKADSAAAAARSAIARANWAKRNNVDPMKTGVELHEVPALINRRAAQVEAELRQANPSLPDETIRIQTRQQVGREFGLSR